MRRIPVVLILLVSTLAAACGGSSAGALSGKSPSQVLALAQQAATQEGAFHFVDQTKAGKDTETLAGDVSNPNGQELLTNLNGSLEVRLVGPDVYVRGSAASLTLSLKYPSSLAKQYAGKWISLDSSDPPFSSFAGAILPSAELQDYIPAGDLVLGKPTTLRKQAVLPVSGTAPAVAGGKGIATLYVSATAPFVPVGGALIGIGTQSADNEAVAFTAWGEKVDFPVPSPVVAYSSIHVAKK
jgi:hypothetical protein